MQLLMDAREVLREHEDRISTQDLIERLGDLEDSPWPNYNLKARDPGQRRITVRQVAGLFKRYGVTPGVLRLGGHTPRGYLRVDIDKALARYRPPDLCATAQHSLKNNGLHSAPCARILIYAQTLYSNKGT
jgi:hypothetical protein